MASKVKKGTPHVHDYMKQVERYEKAIENSNGNLTAIAARLGMSRSTFYLQMAKHPELKRKVEEEREKLLDVAENWLHVGMKNNPTLLMFFLKTQGKRRGFVERQEVEQSGEVTRNIKISQSDVKNALEELKNGL